MLLLLADIIYVFHIFIILFVILAPFSNYSPILLLHVTGCISLLIHWYANNNMCSLTLIESKLRGIEEYESFSHKFIAPIYDISKTSWSKICYVITLTVFTISLYKLINHTNWINMLQCFGNIYNDINMSYFTKIYEYLKCIQILFLWNI